MKRTFALLAFCVVLSVPAFAQQQNAGSPAYDNVHYKQGYEQKRLPKANEAPPVTITPKAVPPVQKLSYSNNDMKTGPQLQSMKQLPFVSRKAILSDTMAAAKKP